jgi:hypothetical protein
MELLAPGALAAIIAEMFGGLLWVAAIVVLLDLVLLVVALRRGAAWRAGARIAALSGVLVAAAVLVALPPFTNAAHGDLSGALDWIVWAMVGIGAGAAAALAALPALALGCAARHAAARREVPQRGAASSLR